MTPTTKMMQEKFVTFNKMFFNNELEMPEFKIARTKTAVGQCVTYIKTDAFGRRYNHHYKISLSKMFKFTEQDICEVMIHEMIHLYISQNHIKDTSSHGFKFLSIAQRIMQECNNKYNITISRTQETIDKIDMRTSFAYISKNNKLFVFVSTPNSVRFFERLLCLNGVKYQTYQSNHKEFIDYPTCRNRVRGRYITIEKIKECIPSFKESDII